MKDVGLQFLLLFESGFGSGVMLALWNILECVLFKCYSLGEICQVGVTSLYVCCDQRSCCDAWFQLSTWDNLE